MKPFTDMHEWAGFVLMADGPVGTLILHTTGLVSRIDTTHCANAIRIDRTSGVVLWNLNPSPNRRRRSRRIK